MTIDITAQAGKGPRKHRNVSTRRYRAGFDAINWKSSKPNGDYLAQAKPRQMTLDEYSRHALPRL